MPTHRTATRHPSPRPACRVGAGTLVLGLLPAALVACEPEAGGPPECADGPAVDRVRVADPVLPGTPFEVAGRGFDEACGAVSLVFRGEFAGRFVEIEATPGVLSDNAVRYEAGAELRAGLGADTGRFSGEAGVRRRDLDGTVREATVPLSFDVSVTLAPRVTSATPAMVTLNAVVVLAGEGFLDGGAEGTSWVILDGTFAVDGGGTRDVVGMRLGAAPAEAHDRSRTTFLWAPAIAGIGPGTFRGTLRVENAHAVGGTVAGDPFTAEFTLGPSLVTGVRPTDPTLGSIVTIEGAGFIGGAADQTLTVRLDGTATPRGGSPVPVTGLELVPRFVDGGRAEYVIVPVVDGDALVAADFGFSWGSYSGTATPVLRYGAERVEGLALPLEMTLGPTRQVVHVAFLAAFSDTMREVGMRAVESDVRARVLERFREVYVGVNVGVRDTWPADYYVGGYAVIEIGGPDPNGRGLFGYDNTPGKDVGNLRLHDRIGGTNAEVQEDGYPGYGGVFVRSFLCWSGRPPADMECPEGISDPEFDRVFDPVRAREVVAGEYPDGPDAGRATEIGEAVRVLGNLIGDTAAHEFGHSLGLAHPYGPRDLVHNEPPGEGCLMDAGAYRPFAERAGIGGARPGGFCGDERAYLETILPVGP